MSIGMKLTLGRGAASVVLDLFNEHQLAALLFILTGHVPELLREPIITLLEGGTCQLELAGGSLFLSSSVNA